MQRQKNKIYRKIGLSPHSSTRFGMLFTVMVVTVIGLIPMSHRLLAGDDLISFIMTNRTVLENIKSVEEKADLFQKIIEPTLQKTTDPVQKTAWLVVGGVAGSDYRKNCVAGISAFQQAIALVDKMTLEDREKVIAILENPEFIDFKVATRLPMGYNAYAVKRLAADQATAREAIIEQLRGWTDYYSAILDFLYELSQPLDQCGVCTACVNCPLYKFKVTFFNYKTILNQDEFYKELDFIKQAASHAQDLGRAIESRYDLQ